MNTTPTIETINPADLLIDRNLRETRIDKTLLASIKANGLLEPPRVVRTTDGALRVRDGHHRTAAAIKAGLDTIPVLVIGDDGDDPADAALRTFQQIASNEHRTGLTRSAHLDAIAQLAAFGVSTATIAKKTATPKATIEAAITVANNDTARELATHPDHQISLEHAAAIAEFGGDDQAIERLTRAAGWHGDTGFAHALQREHDRRDRRTVVERAATALRGTDPDLPIIEPIYTISVHRLTDLTEHENGPTLTPQTHEHCPGRAAWIDVATVYITKDGRRIHEDDLTHDDPDDDELATELVADVVHVCTAWDTHGHYSTRYGSSVPTYATGSTKHPTGDKDAAKEKARETRANNKAWRAAEPIRRDWLAGFAKRKTAPKDAAAAIATALITSPKCRHSYAINRGTGHAAELLGGGDADPATYIAEQLAKAPTGRQTVILATIALCIYEADTSVETWRGQWGGIAPRDTTYFQLIASWGYDLADIEQTVATPTT